MNKVLQRLAVFVAVVVSCGVAAGQSCPTAPPTLVAPIGGVQVPFGEIELKWDEVDNASLYEVVIAVDGGQPSPIGQTTDTKKKMVVEPGRQIQWTAKALAPSCTPQSATPATFSTTCPTEASKLSAPARNASFLDDTDITFIWDTVGGAAGYDLQISSDFGESWQTIAENLTGRTNKVRLQAGDYGWRIRANFNGGCNPLYSEAFNFRVTSGACNREPVALKAPADGATAGLPITFEWSGDSDATGYAVFISSANATTPRLLGVTTQTSLRVLDLDDGTYDWFVITGYDDPCPDVRSATRKIIVKTECPTAGPALTAPLDQAQITDTTVKFEWNPVAGALSYRLFVATNDEFAFYGQTEDTELERQVPEGVIRWYVTAVLAGCPPLRSNTFTFTVGLAEECPEGQIQLTAPAQAAIVTSPVRFEWNAAIGAGGAGLYLLFVARDGEAPVQVARTTATEATINLPSGSFTWYVAGQRPNCDPLLSGERRFTVEKAANCASKLPPAIISPAGTRQNPVVVTGDVTFLWQSSDLYAHRIWVSRNGAPFEDIALVRQTTYTTTLGPDIYEWYPEGLAEGCDPLPAATTGFFRIAETTGRCNPAPATLLQPANGATVGSRVVLQWSEVDDARKYRVFGSRDGGEPVLVGETPDTELEQVLPPGAYVWTVQAAFKECPSTMSARSTFVIPRGENCSVEGPQLIAPENGATQATNQVDFSWAPLDGALRYLLIARAGDGAPTVLGETTGTHLNRRVPFGRITWNVIAFFSDCEPAPSSQFLINIEALPVQQNCVTIKPILLQPASEGEPVPSPVRFEWTRVPGATGYQLWVYEREQDAEIVATTTDPRARVNLPPGRYGWYAVALFEACPSAHSARSEVIVAAPIACATPRRPEANVVGQVLSTTPYRLRWNALANVSLYEVQESTSPGFEVAETVTTEETTAQFQNAITSGVQQFFYRVRGVSSCNDSRGPYSKVVSTFVITPRTNNASTEIGVEGVIEQKLFLKGGSTPQPFTISVDKPYVTPVPASGIVPPEGLEIGLRIDQSRANLGTNTYTVTTTFPNAAKGPRPEATSVVTPISISLVTPVVPSGQGTPPPDALIFPVVGHATGVNESLFESDIRIANLSAQTMKYQVNFTPSGTNGTETGSSTTIEIPPNQTTALDDIVASVFGTGTTSSALGMLQVRPLTTEAAPGGFFSTITSLIPPLTTAASSRTYNFTPDGTFGQFIPAIPFSKFVGRSTTGGPNPILTLLQVSQSTAFRANFGFNEAAGLPVDLLVRAYDTRNTLLGTISVSLQASEHKQINQMLAANGITNLPDGRVDVEVVGGDGKVTAYVSEIDNRTNDPLLVSSVLKGGTTSNRYVVPGMAYLNTGFAFWVSDLRIFNAGSTATPATLTFYPQGNPGASISKDIVLDAGEIEVLDNVLVGFFGQTTNTGGSIAITTPSDTTLNATARTYNQTAEGTYGQFIAGVTPAESFGSSDRALQLLQLEQSTRIRTNIGVTETTGSPATVEVSVIQPDSLATPVITFTLAANEFRQFSLADFNLGNALYNARVTVKVTGGAGRVTAYGSAIDQITQDPTYVPAQ